jgi:hypothetical protein
MIPKLREALRKFRFANPQRTLGLNDEDVIELMLLVAAQQDNSPVSLVGQGDDERPIFGIRLTPDGSDDLS